MIGWWLSAISIRSNPSTSVVDRRSGLDVERAPDVEEWSVACCLHDRSMESDRMLDDARGNGGAKVDCGSGVVVALRAA